MSQFADHSERERRGRTEHVSLAALSRAMRPALYSEEEKQGEAAARLVRIGRVSEYARLVDAYRPHAMALRPRVVWDEHEGIWVRSPDPAPSLADLLRDPEIREEWLDRLAARTQREAA